LRIARSCTPKFQSQGKEPSQCPAPVAFAGTNFVGPPPAGHPHAPETIPHQREIDTNSHSAGKSFANGLLKLSGFQILPVPVQPSLRVRTNSRPMASSRGCTVCSSVAGSTTATILMSGRCGCLKRAQAMPAGKVLRSFAPFSSTSILQLWRSCPGLGRRSVISKVPASSTYFAVHNHLTGPTTSRSHLMLQMPKRNFRSPLRRSC
jgi:hypothetical protein